MEIVEERKSEEYEVFYFTVKCEHCGALEELSTEYEEHYKKEVIPGMSCKSCGKASREQ